MYSWYMVKNLLSWKLLHLTTASADEIIRIITGHSIYPQIKVARLTFVMLASQLGSNSSLAYKAGGSGHSITLHTGETMKALLL